MAIKKVLIVTWHFSKRESSGSGRLRGLVKYLPEFGWEPTVLTIDDQTSGSDLCRVVKTPFEDVTTKWKRRLGMQTGSTFKDQYSLKTVKNRSTATDLALKAWEEIFSYPDNCIGWYSHALSAADEIMRDDSFDAVLSSSHPETTHLIAHDIQGRHGIPWVADLRDLWTQNHYFPHWWFRRVRERALEVRTFSTASALTTVSEPLALKLEDLHGKKAVAIPNGFDPEDIREESPLDKVFSITYPGVLYRGRRDPEVLFRAVKELISEGRLDQSDLAIDFYGPRDEWLKENVEMYGLQGVVRLNGPTPRGEVLKRERESQLLLLLMWKHPDERGVYTGKIFEYLAAQRPILAIDGLEDGVVVDLLRRTKAGVNVSDLEGLKRELMAHYAEFKERGSVSYRGVRSEIDRFSHREMAKRFSEILDGSAEGRSR